MPDDTPKGESSASPNRNRGIIIAQFSSVNKRSVIHLNLLLTDHPLCFRPAYIRQCRHK
jgi:hypothetical protein